MTAFILVSGPFTDGRIWSEVSARLRKAGVEVHPATLTGMGNRRHLAGPGTDLETHIEDLIRLIDGTEAPEVVLVGHDYGIHPVMAAADRRPERVVRIVFLDAGLPQDGDAAIALVPDLAVHEQLRSDDDEPLSPPAPQEWERWGSTAGLTREDLEGLSALAAPQPRGTLTQALRLTGALAELPTSGILCTKGGMDISVLQRLLASGPPRLRALADPRVGFFELASGHWPMLSCPDELAEVLLRAAAGEGERLVVPEGRPSYLRPFLLDVPERPRVRTGRVDLHLPEAEGPRPAVLFIHGGPIPKDAEPMARDRPFYLGYARYAASLGVVGATVEHQLYGCADYGQTAADLTEAVELVRADPRVDPDRVALWFFSRAGLLAAEWLAAPPSWLRCVAANYPVLAPLPGWGPVDRGFRPVSTVSGAGRLPIVLTRTGLELPDIAATSDAFLAAAEDSGARVEVIDVPNGHHGFETVDPTDESRDAVARAMRSVLTHLRA